VKAAAFDYLAPESMTAAIEALAEYGGEAKVLAGGQSLMPLLNFRLVRPAALIDLRRVPDLTGIGVSGASIRIGAMTTHRSVELEGELLGRCRMLGEALGVIGHVAIRNVGTVGGSMAHADAAAEWPVLALALDGRFTAVGTTGQRTITAKDFFTGWMSTALAPDEILTRIDLSLPPSGAGTAFREVSRRHGDFGLAGVATVISGEDGLVSAVRISLLGLALKPVRAAEAEHLLVGREPTNELFDEAAKAIDAVIQPLSDQHATEAYKRHLGKVLTVRALRAARDRSALVGAS
jgi:carbon-monoxide dehydrogenase medium subunit